jgi:hypothetical protein
MAYKHTDILSGSPYYDDFADTKNFLRILFKPGYSVQARELTQLQTLLQNQVSKLGSHVFKNGSLVYGGVSTLTECKFLRVKQTDINHEDLRGKVISDTSSTDVLGSTTASKAKIVYTLPEVIGTDEYTILFLQYLTGNELNNAQRLFIGSTVQSITVKSTTVDTSIPVSGSASLVSVEEGIFYVDGFFVNNTKQTTSLYKLDSTSGFRDFSTPTNRVGFSLNRITVDATEDETLKDPANGSYNFNAPGADRYVIELNLTSYVFDDKETKPEEYSTEDFIELARTVNGKLDFVRRTPTYSDLLEIFARRTYDESGSYTVKPFGLELKNHIRSDKFKFVVSRYLGDITKPISSSVQDTFSYSSETGNLPPFPNDILKVYDETTAKTSLLDIVNVSASSDSPYATITAKYQETDINDVLTIGLNTKFYLFRKGNAVPEGGVFYAVVNVQDTPIVTIDQDETGTYTLTDTPKGSEDKFVLSVQPGKAYVYGYEFENINNTNISIDKPRDTVFLNNYEVNANVGNYFVATTTLGADGLYKFNDYSSSLNINEFPPVKLKGQFVEINLPKVEEQEASLPVKYWSPLFASEHTNYSSILFLEPNSEAGGLALLKELPTGSTTYGLIRPEETTDTRKKTIGQKVSATNSIYYNINKSSFATENNISRLVFTEPYHGNFRTAYGQDGNADLDDQFGTDEYRDTTKNYVYQVDYKNIKNAIPDEPTSAEILNYITVKKAETRRWVPAGSSGVTSGSALYIKQGTGNIVFGSGATRGFSLPGSNITDGVGEESGVVFNPEVGSDISYGSSIETVQIQNNIVQITLTKATGVEDCSQTNPPTATDGFGKYRIGDLITQVYDTVGGSTREATGIVLAVSESPDAGNYKIYVEMKGSDDFVTNVNPNPALYSNVGLLYAPCACYAIKGVVVLDNSTCGEFTTIKFTESAIYGEYTAGNRVFQFDVNSLPIDSLTPPTNFVSSKCVAKGTVVSWDANTRTLIILQEKNKFNKESGWVFEIGTGIHYGGRGWDLAKHNENTVSSFEEIEKASGVFVHVSDSYVSGKDFDEDNAFGSAKQIIISAEQNFKKGKEARIGDIITQRNSGITSEGKVVFFKAGDVDNPAATEDESTTTFVLTPNTLNGVSLPFSFNIGAPSSSPLSIKGRSPSVTYAVDSTKVPTGGLVSTTVTGNAKLRQLHRISEERYSVHLFDIAMLNIGSTTSKYPLNSTTHIADTNENDLFAIETANGVSTIYSPQQNTLLFDLPVGDIVQNVSDFKYRIQRDINVTINTTSTTKLIEPGLPANIRFIGGASGTGEETGKVDMADLLEHYIFLNTDNGKVYNLSDTRYFDKIITNNTSEGASSTLTLYMKQSGGNRILPDGDYKLIATMSVGGSTQTGVGIRSKVKKRATKVLTFNSSGVLTIPQSDIISVDYMTTTTGAIYDLTYFTLNNGQTDNIYDYATFKLKPENNGVFILSNEQVLITYTYFEHQGNGPIVVNSYESHNDIPEYISPSTNEKYKLDTVIDFRPYRNSSGTLDGIYGIPVITESFTVDYSYYQAKNYKLVLTRDRKFKVISSPSSLTPVIPPDEPNSMTLYTIESPAYLSNIGDLKITPYNHQRYTMSDIRDLERRISELEHTTRMNLLEKTAKEQSIPDSTTGEELIKTSILVDGFSGHGTGDTLSSDYNCSIDVGNNLLRPPFKTTVIGFDVNTATSTNININNTTGLVTLDYTETPLIIQPLSSTLTTINAFADTVWTGRMNLSPSSDSWFDDTKTPQVLSNQEGENDSFINVKPSVKNNNTGAFGTNYDSWRTFWQGIPRRKFGSTRGSGGYRFGAGYKNINGEKLIFPAPLPVSETPKPTKVNVGEKVVDKDIIPFMREKTISVSITGLKPKTLVYPYFDGIRIDSYCKIGSNDFVNGSNNKTDSSGSISFTFNLPSGKFKVGEKLLTVMDNQSGNREAAQTIAESKYVAAGANTNTNDYFVNTRPAIVDTLNKPKTLLAQTFFVDGNNYPQGVYIKSVELFFRSIDTQNIPVTLEVRPVVSGYPLIGEGSYAYPYASKTIVPSTSSIIQDGVTPTPGSKDGSVASNGTKFTFDAPIHLLPGEHALVLNSNSSEYSVYSAEIGEVQINTGIPISEQPYSGKMYKTNNNTIWTEIQGTDLMFVINRCDFETDGLLVLSEPNTRKSKDNYSVANVNISYVDLNNTIDGITLETLNENAATRVSASIKPNTNIDFGVNKKILYNSSSVRLSLDLSSDGIITPVIDTDKISMICVRNMITTQSRTSEELLPIATTAKARYITKTITLEPGLESTNCSVFMKLCKPQGTAVDVYIKRQKQGTDSAFIEEYYESMTPEFENFVSADENDFREVKYTINADQVGEEFSKFNIKIVLYSTDESIVPIAKELRIISTT